ncbi:MAG TPA: hypothetical protein PLO89_05480, partial [Spirochaetota bacterium]|nr:hypothetical protein [Spirochaetota bacterium]
MKLKKGLILLFLVFLVIFAFSSFSCFRVFLIENFLLTKLYFIDRKDFKNIISIETDLKTNSYILKKKVPSVKNIDFLKLVEGTEFDEMYLNNYKINEKTRGKYSLSRVKSKIPLLPVKKNSRVVINKNDIDTIKSKIDKLNDDFYIEIDKLKSKYENKNLKILKKINKYVKKKTLPYEIREQIYSVFNEKSNFRNIPDYLLELINSLKLANEENNGYQKEILFFEKLYKNSIILNKNGEIGIYSIIYDKKVFFDNIDLVTFEERFVFRKI